MIGLEELVGGEKRVCLSVLGEVWHREEDGIGDVCPV